jgi:uncharacterized protein YhdP
VENVDLRYADGWPHVKQVNAVAEFEGAGMYVEGTVGETAGAVVDKVTASIGDFKKPVLDVKYQTSTPLPSLIGFIKQTPLLDGLALDPDQFEFAGDSEITGHIHTRLGQSSKPLQVTGELLLKGNQFTDHVSGTVLSDWDADEVFRASLHGNLPVEKVVPDDLLQREPLFAQATGTGRWDISLSVASVAGSEDRETWLEIYSGLEGISIDLPAPLQKSADLSWPLLVRYPIRAQKNILTADFLSQLQLKMELSKDDARPIRAAVQLGGKVENLPDPGLFVVNGSTSMFDLDGWIDLTVQRLSETEDVGGLTLQTASVDAGQVMIFDRRFDEVELEMLYDDGVISGDFESEDINGTVRYYKNEEGSHSMSGEFERLMLPDPVTQGMTMESDPSSLPEMHFYAKEFSYLGINLGETRIEGYPVNNGFHIESIKAQSPSLILSARGDWLRDDAGERSDFNIHITSESLGTVLEAMDISSAMQGGQTLIHFDAWWQGPPAAFALERLNGEMDLSVVQGNILTADPGAGRMLGLLSLTELPRRLAMDFRDVFNEGFYFDEAKGTMRFENGTSYTDDLILSSTAADITITGSTDLVAQTFDYEFVVRPGVSKTLPVIGAIAGGPVGAAAGLALQAILRDALGEAAEARYTIRGPWTDPQVEPVGKLPKPRAGDSGLDSAVEPEVQVEEPAEEQPETQPDKEAGSAGQQSTDENIND